MSSNCVLDDQREIIYVKCAKCLCVKLLEKLINWYNIKDKNETILYISKCVQHIYNINSSIHIPDCKTI